MMPKRSDPQAMALLSDAVSKHATATGALHSQIVNAFLAGCSVRAIQEATGMAQGTLIKIRNDAGVRFEPRYERVGYAEGTPIPDPDPTGEYPDGWHPATSRAEESLPVPCSEDCDWCGENMPDSEPTDQDHEFGSEA